MSVEQATVQEQPEAKAVDVNVEGGSENVQTEVDEQLQVTPVLATKGGRETSDRILYVGNLDKDITEELLKQYFQVGGAIANVKVLVDKNNEEANYAFVEYHQPHDANVAFQTLDGKQIENNVIKINWAFQSQQVSSEDTFNLFVGDLNVDVDDETLSSTFKEFPTFIQAHVMWDMLSGRSRGYGFVSFGKQEEAQNAMDAKQGFNLNGRAIRINWASKREPQQQKQRPRSNRGGFRNNIPGHQQFRGPPPPPQVAMKGSPNAPGPMGMHPQGIPPQAHPVPPPVNPQALDNMLRRAPQRVTTAYIGNIPHFAQEPDLIPLLQNFGFIIDFKHYPEKGCCFIKYDTHEQAAVCIVALANFPFQGRNLKTGWGKEKPTFMPNGMVPPQHMQHQSQPHTPVEDTVDRVPEQFPETPDMSTPAEQEAQG
ncbi:HDL237Cp [Eremothecium sinecaudum]|uniref:HDL237Cp n=1 Tax=Eremothecium sinecaudum TaxID=45286 RepID=A0A120K259_9SACH|nr:HDL237Cp [Eremothecium sinecaudum]AMD20507.1 HDL237Cp [Eremothecium sinecaudum]